MGNTATGPESVSRWSVSFRLWQEYFPGRPVHSRRASAHQPAPVFIIGRAVVASGISRRFSGDRRWTARILSATDRRESRREARNFQAIVRLKPGVSISEANAEVAMVVSGLPAPSEDQRGDRRPIVPDFGRRRRGQSSALVSPLDILGVACGLVLLIACANVTNLLLARFRIPAEGVRRSEPPWARVRVGWAASWYPESLLLAALATLGGLLFALWFPGLPVKLVPPTGIPVYFNAHPSVRGIPFCRPDLPSASALISGLSARGVSVGAAQCSGCTEARRKRRYTERVLATASPGYWWVAEVGLAFAALVTLGLFLRKPLRFGEHSGRFRSPQRDGEPSFFSHEQLYSP